MYNENKSVRIIRSSLNLSKRTCNKLKTRIIKNSTIKKFKRGRKSKIKDEYISYLEDWLSKDENIG